MPANLENSAVATGLEKVSFHSNPKERQCQRMFKLLNNCTHLTCQQSNAQNSSSQASTVCELRTSGCSNWIQKRQKNQRLNCQHALNHRKSKRIPENIYFCLKPLTVWITTNCGKFLKRWEYQTTYLSPEKPVFGSRSKSELDLEERADSKLGKEYNKAVYCHPAYLNSMQRTSHEMPGWIKHKLETRLPGDNQ